MLLRLRRPSTALLRPYCIRKVIIVNYASKLVYNWSSVNLQSDVQFYDVLETLFAIKFKKLKYVLDLSFLPSKASVNSLK